MNSLPTPHAVARVEGHGPARCGSVGRAGQAGLQQPFADGDGFRFAEGVRAETAGGAGQASATVVWPSSSEMNVYSARPTRKNLEREGSSTRYAVSAPRRCGEKTSSSWSTSRTDASSWVESSRRWYTLPAPIQGQFLHGLWKRIHPQLLRGPAISPGPACPAGASRRATAASFPR